MLKNVKKMYSKSSTSKSSLIDYAPNVTSQYVLDRTKTVSGEFRRIREPYP